MRTTTIIIALALAALAWATEEAAPAAPAPLARPAVTFLPFTDSSPNAGTEIPRLPGQPFDVKEPMPWLADGIPAALEITLERSAAVNVIPRADFAFALLKRRETELTTSAPPDVIIDVARREGGTHLVGGVFSKVEDKLSFTVNVVSVDGVSVFSKEYPCDVKGVFDATDAAASDILVAIGVPDARAIPREPTADLEGFMWFARAAAKVNTGERIGFLTRAIEQDPNFAEAHLRLGDAYRLEKAYADAQAEYETSRRLADYYPSAPAGLAVVNRKIQPENPDAAIAYENEALAIDPNYAPAYDGLGGLYFSQNKFTEAAAAYAKFSEIWPTNKDGYYALGNSLWLGGKDNPQWKQMLTQAIEAYSKSLQIDDEFAAGHYNIASVYKIFEDVEKAVIHYRRYVELEPNSPKRAEIEATIADWETKFGKTFAPSAGN